MAEIQSFQMVLSGGQLFLLIVGIMGIGVVIGRGMTRREDRYHDPH